MEWRHGNAGLTDEPALASHLVSIRSFYTHHGIYVGAGRVIHYGGLAIGCRHGRVEEVSLERFANGGRVRVRDEEPGFDRRQVVERARSRLGENRYSLLTNNCEHFCTWALHGESRSPQVERVFDALFPHWHSYERSSPWPLFARTLP